MANNYIQLFIKNSLKYLNIFWRSKSTNYQFCEINFYHNFLKFIFLLKYPITWKIFIYIYHFLYNMIRFQNETISYHDNILSKFTFRLNKSIVWSTVLSPYSPFNDPDVFFLCFFERQSISLSVSLRALLSRFGFRLLISQVAGCVFTVELHHVVQSAIDNRMLTKHSDDLLKSVVWIANCDSKRHKAAPSLAPSIT